MTMPATCLLVLGMHRSGTSAVTRILNLLGAALPRDLLPPASDNPTGFWEGAGVVSLNDAILEHAGLRWCDPGPLPTGLFESPAAAEAVTKLAAFSTSEFAGESLFAIKDPRVCRLAPIWLDALSAVPARVVPILVLRDPHEVARSLAARSALPVPVPVGLTLWLRHMIEVEAATRNLPRIILRYDRILADWRSVVVQIAHAHGFSWPRPVDEAGAAIDAFLAPGLRHQHASAAPPKGALERDWVVPAFEALVGGADGGAVNTAALDRIRGELELADQRYGEAAQLAAASVQPLVPELIGGLARAKEEIAGLRARVKVAEDQTAHAYAHARQVAAAFEGELIRLAGRYDELLASSSWRMTAPVRWAAARAKGGEAEPPDLDLPVDAHDGEAARLRALEQIAWSGLFFGEYYLERHADAVAGSDPLRHFVEQGAALGFDPNPWFDIAFYRANNPRLAASGGNPLVDYIDEGAWSGPDPHPRFSTARYLELHPELRDRRMTPLSHFLRYEMPAVAPSVAPSEQPRALHALAPLDPGVGWFWERMAQAGALVRRRGSGVGLATEHFGEPDRAKLLIAAHELSRTGAPLVLLELVRRLAERYDVELFLLTDRAGELLDAFAAHTHVIIADRYLPFAAGAGIADLPSLLAHLAAPAPVVAFCNTANTEHYARAFKRAGIPVTLLAHEAATPYTAAQVGRLFEVSDTVVAVSCFARQTMLDKIGEAAARTVIVPPGLLLPALLEDDGGVARAAVRRQLGVPEANWISVGWV